MDGYHLRNNTANDVSQPYNIRSIPRFIIVDSKGLIFKNPAKRPSEKGVEDEINEALKK